MRTGAAPWEVLVATPADLGDFGLHQDVDVAAAAFRRHFARAFAGSEVAEHGAAAEQQFRQARAMLDGQPVLWSGFLMLTTPAAAGLAAEDVVEASGDREEDQRRRDLAAVPAVFLVLLSVRVRHLPPPATDGPMSQAAALARSLSHLYGEDGTVHRVSYGEVSGVASVRTVSQSVAGTSVGGLTFAEDSEPVERILAEVALVFPAEEALVTVTAGVTHGAALADAVLLAGSVAQTVRVRRPDARPAAGTGAPDVLSRVAAPPGTPASAPEPSAAEASPAGTPAAVPLRVVLPDGSLLADGSTVLGRAPRGRTADHVVRLRDESVSRTHLLLRREGGRVGVTDLGSSNGTILARRGDAPTSLPRHQEVVLTEGDVVVLGAERIVVTHDPDDAG